MGITLSEPVTTKMSLAFESEKYKVGVSSMQGWRVTMEDAHAVHLSLPGDPEAAMFAVFDGHGGSKVSEFASLHFHEYILKQDLYAKGNIEDAFKNAFLELDAYMRSQKELTDDMSGSTAVIVLIKNGNVYCANLGDSRAFAYVEGAVIPLSEDHKPDNYHEYKRITEAGGWVEVNRVNGSLAVSRALGDYTYKTNPGKPAEEQAVSPLPEISTKKIGQTWEFIVLACDGIWDVMTNEEVGDFVKMKLLECLHPVAICEDLMTKCLSPFNNMGGIGCDNMTVIIVLFPKHSINIKNLQPCKDVLELERRDSITRK